MGYKNFFSDRIYICEFFYNEEVLHAFCACSGNSQTQISGVFKAVYTEEFVRKAQFTLRIYFMLKELFIMTWVSICIKTDNGSK